MHQVSDSLEVHRKVTTLQELAGEGPRGSEMSLSADEAGRDGEQVHIRDRRKIFRNNVELHSVSVRSIAMGWETAESELAGNLKVG